jgi:hypothetical protein
MTGKCAIESDYRIKSQKLSRLSSLRRETNKKQAHWIDIVLATLRTIFS